MLLDCQTFGLRFTVRLNGIFPFHSVQTGSGAPANVYRGESGAVLRQTTDLHPVLKLRMFGTIPPFSHTSRDVVHS
jgi:hypothetical protein